MTDDDLSRLRMAVSNPRDFWSFVHGDAWALLGDALDELAEMRADDPRAVAGEVSANLYEEGALSDFIKRLRSLTKDKAKADIVEGAGMLAEELAEFDREEFEKGEYVRDVLGLNEVKAPLNGGG